jgi:hypothetical protein
MDAKQFGFGDYEQSTAKKRTKRERFLAEIGLRQLPLDPPGGHARAGLQHQGNAGWHG